MDAADMSIEHLQALLRRQHDDDDDESRVTVDSSLYRSLLQASSEYAALKKALAIAGVGSENLETLIKSQMDSDADTITSVSLSASPRLVKAANLVETPQEVVASPEKLSWTADAPVFVPRSASRSPFKRQIDDSDIGRPIIPLDYDQVFPAAAYGAPGEVINGWSDEEETDFYHANHQDRTLMIRGLSPSTTLADLVKVIRGGIILNMYIRARDRIAIVSFFDPMAAEKFIMHSRRNDIYLKAKRLEVTWADRQVGLPGHIQRQVYNQGASRNIVVRLPSNAMTEETIREDLEHIHNLEVVAVVTANNHIFISLNGIQFAITARHCMQSRLKYKGTRIEFFEDECDQVLRPIERKIYKKPQENKRPATVSMANRFALLFEDDEVSVNEGEMATKRSVSACEVKEPA